MLERLLVFGRQPVAQLDEVRARDGNRLLARLVRRLEVRVVGQRRIAANAVVVLHAALGWQAVVVPPHRIEHRLAAHALEARDDVGVRVREHVADVQRAADRRRRRVDRVDLVARLIAVEAIGPSASHRSFHLASSPSRAGFSGREMGWLASERQTFTFHCSRQPAAGSRQDIRAFAADCARPTADFVSWRFLRGRAVRRSRTRPRRSTARAVSGARRWSTRRATSSTSASVMTGSSPPRGETHRLHTGLSLFQRQQGGERIRDRRCGDRPSRPKPEAT